MKHLNAKSNTNKSMLFIETTHSFSMTSTSFHYFFTRPLHYIINHCDESQYSKAMINTESPLTYVLHSLHPEVYKRIMVLLITSLSAALSE